MTSTHSGTTHDHLLALVASTPARTTDQLRVLDAGCGSGALVALLHDRLGEAWPERPAPEVHGFDIVDQQLHVTEPTAAAVRRLTADDPTIDWRDRISAIGADAPWPYDDASFDTVVSNQVLEHVVDLDHFLHETTRVLRPGGVSHHLFPLRNYFVEGHLLLPIVHRLRSHEVRESYIRAMSRVGIGKYEQGTDVDAFAERHADYVHHLTTYRTWSQLADAAARAGLRIDYGWTMAYYQQKVRRLRGLEPVMRYGSRPPASVQMAAFHLCKYISSVTVTLTPKQSYVK